MLKKSILTVLSTIVFATTAFAGDVTNVKIQPVGSSGISINDIAVVSADWANGDLEAYNHMLRYFNPDLAMAILKSAPDLSKNKRALVSLTMGILIMNEQSELDVNKAIRGISTHRDLISKPVLSVEDVVNALTSVSL